MANSADFEDFLSEDNLTKTHSSNVFRFNQTVAFKKSLIHNISIDYIQKII